MLSRSNASCMDFWKGASAKKVGTSSDIQTAKIHS